MPLCGILARGLLFVLAASSLTLAASAQPVAVSLNGYPVPLDQPPLLSGGRVLVPMRGIFQKMGADVVYLPSRREVEATRGGTTVLLTLGSRTAYVDGRPLHLDTPPQAYFRRTMVPLRFISQALGAEVRWDAPSRTVFITTREPVAVMPSLRVLSPGVNQIVPSVFNFVASTGPGLRVDFSLEVSPPPAPGYVVAEKRVTRVTVNADANGQVVIPVRVHGPQGARVIMTASAQDQQGRQSPTEQVTALHYDGPSR